METPTPTPETPSSPDPVITDGPAPPDSPNGNSIGNPNAPAGKPNGRRVRQRETARNGGKAKWSGRTPKSKSLATALRKQAAIKARFLKAVRRYHSITTSCERTRISRAVVYNWREQDPDFDLAVDAARAAAVEGVEGTLFELARSKQPEYNGCRYFILKSRMRQIYGERIAHTGPDDGPLVIRGEVVEKLRKMEPEKRKMLRGLVSELEGLPPEP